ncbi:carnitine dehydratase [Williamsia sp. 1138]|uniref:CaiB/BaiF CoA transferase family protein n=1 Tax=Williamsia sp. 1138 TaxID=1903117 RepID=UPI000A101D0E|nr:CoA transferase [Williamsia sp. 1138]OZG28696.1 carnitine dehydratase [Williamsia sp. 1138]
MSLSSHSSEGVAIDGRAAWQSSNTKGVLAGLRVLDLSRVLAGPFTAQMLADHGADVLKVEAPEGDETRMWGPPFGDEGSSAYYAGLNHSKDNITLDLRSEGGRAILAHLLDAADVVVENFKAGTMANWGFDYETVLAESRPDLVYCRITGFGVDGPMGGLPGYDAVLQSYGGLMSVNGYPDGNPLRVGVPIVDITAANMAFSGTLLALLDRMRTGLGQLVDIALLDAVVSILHPHSANWIVSEAIPQRTGDLHPTVVPYQVFPTAEGGFFVSAANNRQFAGLVSVLGVPELIEDPRFETNSGRNANRDALIDVLTPLIANWSRDKLAGELTVAGVPSSPVNNVEQALTSPQVLHRELFIDSESYRGLGVPISLSRSSIRAPTPALRAGADSDRILTSMGYGDAHIHALRSMGVLGDRSQ